MKYIDLINDFWQQDQLTPLKPAETKLYFYLLHVCNSIRWKNPFEINTRIIERDLDTNRMGISRMREALQNAELATFQPRKNGPLAVLLRKQKVSNLELLREAFSGVAPAEQSCDESSEAIVTPTLQSRDNIVTQLSHDCNRNVTQLSHGCYNTPYNINIDKDKRRQSARDHACEETSSDSTTNAPSQAMPEVPVFDSLTPAPKAMEDSSEQYRKFLHWAGINLEWVSTHMVMLTQRQFESLTSQYDISYILNTAAELENRLDLRGRYKSLYRTLLNWCRNGKSQK